MFHISIKKTIYKFSPSIIRPFIDKIEASDIGSRMAKGAFWSMAGTVVSRGLMLSAYIIVARILGREIYGEYGIIRSTVNMFMVFAGFGLAMTGVKYVAEYRISDPMRAGRVIAISSLFATTTGLIVMVGIILFADVLAVKTLNAPHLANVLRIGAIALLFSALNGAQIGALSGFEAFKRIANVNLCVGLISLPLLICGAYFGGLNGAVWGMCGSTIVNWLLNHLALRKELHKNKIPFTFKHCYNEMPILWKFSLPAVISGLLVSPVRWACNAFLVNKPNGYDEMGILTAALVFQQLLLFTGDILNTPFISILSSAGSVKNYKNYKLETMNILSSWLLGLFFSIPLLCFPEIGGIVFGGKYQSYSFKVTFAMIIFYTYILTYRSGLLRVLISKNLLWWGFGNNLLWSAILLPSAFFMSQWGAIGLAASFAIAYICTSIVFIPIYLKKGGVPRELLISKENIAIWLMMILLTVGSFWNIPIIFRIAALLLSYAFTGWAVRQIWYKNTKKILLSKNEKLEVSH